MGFVFDTRQHPFHLQVFPAAYHHVELEDHFAKVERFYERLAVERPHDRVVLLADLRGSGPVDARGRRRISETFARLESVMERRAVAHAVVMTDALLRAALTAVLWLKTPPWPIRVFATMEEGHDWLVQSLAERGVTAPTLPAAWWSLRRR